MEAISWNPILEALLFAAGDEGLSLDQISSVLEVSKLEAREIIQKLQDTYKDEMRGINIVEMAGVYQLVTKKVHATYLKKLVESPANHTLSQAALETLAIISYKQPITRSEIEAIRGVKIDGPLQKLVSRLLVREVGRLDAIGRPILYGTTNEFLDYFGLKSLDELPELPLLNEGELFNEEADLFSLKYQESEPI
ncbi:MAG: scpB [Bacillales bacterium]|nr:scpB [Bacillales bacterium]